MSSPSPWTLSFQAVDDPDEGQRWSTWRSVEKGARGPEPRPDWVVTEDAAIDTELGILKTGKEADVFLVERAVPGRDGAVMAAKRYRSEEHRSFHRSATYTEGRRTRRSRDARALAKKTAHGRVVAAGFYQGEGIGLRLGEEFHLNQVELVSSQIGSVPSALKARWDRDRLERVFVELLADHTLDLSPLVSHVFDVADVADAFTLLDERPAEALQVVLRFPAARSQGMEPRGMESRGMPRGVAS